MSSARIRRRSIVMKDWKLLLDGLPAHLLAWIWAALLFLQMGLAFFVFTEPRSQGLRVAGWTIWALGTVFAVVPIFTLRTRGRVPPGKSYMETTDLVDTGIYAIVRHPQSGTAGILLNLALALIGQHWLLVILAAVSIALLYIDLIKADQACIQKFGPDYEDYMKRVPGVNFLAGILRLLTHPGSGSTGV
jgi:protein-S-isoprenylcysteine O-methyltransferase Ste14